MNTHLLNRGKIRIDNLFFGAVLAVAFLCGFAPQKAEAQAEVSFEYFQDSLQPYGNWVDVEEYGSCWVPNTNYSDWRPYSDGSWAYTECGWTWVSDEPWGWATYHYGRWVYLDGPGWAWVPGYEWAPAWVAWRSSDDYIGWAPLPPEAVWIPNRGFSVSVNFNFGPSYYNFCEVRNFGSRRLRDVICRRDRNVTIIRNTVNVTRIVNNNTTIINQGPDIEAVNRRSERRIERLRLERRQDSNGIQRAERQGDRLEVFAPKVRAPEQTARGERAERIGRAERSQNRALKTQNDQGRNVTERNSQRRAEQTVVEESSGSAKELNSAPPERQNNRRNSGARSQPERRQSRVVEPAVQAPVTDRIVEQKTVAPTQDRTPQVREQKRESNVRSEAPRVQETRQPRAFQQAPQPEPQRESRVRTEAPRVQEQRQERAVQRAPEPERQRERPVQSERPAQQVRENKREAPPAAQQAAPTREQLTEKKRHGH